MIALIAGGGVLAGLLLATAGFAVARAVSDDGFGPGMHMGWRGDGARGDGPRDGRGPWGNADSDNRPNGNGQGNRPDAGRPGGGPGMMGQGQGGGMMQRGLQALGGVPLHAEVVVPNADGTFSTVAVQRGEVTAVSATSITLKSTDGFTQTYAVSDATKVRLDRDSAAIGDVKVGDKALVEAGKSGSTLTVQHLLVGDLPGGGGWGAAPTAATASTATATAA